MLGVIFGIIGAIVWTIVRAAKRFDAASAAAEA